MKVAGAAFPGLNGLPFPSPPVEEVRLSRRTPSADAAPDGGPRGIGDVKRKSTTERLVAESPLPRVWGRLVGERKER